MAARLQLLAADQPRTMDQVMDRVISNEQRLYGQMRNYSPLVETYIQNLQARQGSRAGAGRGQIFSGPRQFLRRASAWCL